MKFNDMKYVRPDVEQLKEQVNGLIEKLNGAESFEEAEKVFLEYDELTGHVETMLTLAYIRHTVDTLDEFYDKENEFIDESMPLLSEVMQNWTMALLASPFKSDFADKYGELLFTNAEMELKTFSPEIVGEIQEENKLISEYQKLVASAQVEFDGGTYTLSQLTPFKQSPDDEKRVAAWNADGGFYRENKAALDRIYDELTHLRDKMAKKLGYENYIELGYYRMQRNSYTKEDVDSFRKSVQKYLVPVADRIYREQAERTGKSYPLNYADAALMFTSGNAKPQGSADDILAHGKKFYHELSDETAEFIDFMMDNELMDVLSKKGKAAGGYCTSIPDYKAQFIFANFNGTSGDVEVITHEAGHAFAGYTARNIVPNALHSPSLESCEIHSMSMEFFAWDWAEGFFGSDTEKFKYQHLADALKFIPYGTMVDHFQHIVFENPDLTPAERDEEWKKLTAIYMPWIKLGEIPFYGDGCAWQRQTHIYCRPFYYIDYCLAQTVALEFWAEMQKDRAMAWEAYMKLVKLAGTRKFTRLVEAAGLISPFNEAALEEVCNTAVSWLDAFDKNILK